MHVEGPQGSPPLAGALKRPSLVKSKFREHLRNRGIPRQWTSAHPTTENTVDIPSNLREPHRLL